MVYTFLCLFLFSLVLVKAQFPSSTGFTPAAYPLAVRSAYVNTWFIPNNSTSLNSGWPVHWDIASINGWSGFVRVDGVGYTWLGQPPGQNTTNVTSTKITPTSTVFTVAAGPLELTIAFISPIEPGDLVKQSFPFVYLAVDVASTDGKAHSVQLYSDISAEWISGDRSNIAVWNTTQTTQSVFHQATRQSPEPFQEIADLAEDSTVYFGMALGPSVSWQSGPDAATRQQFTSQGSMTGTSDPNFRAINVNFPVFGIAADLGTITSSAAPTVWCLGSVRDPIIQYATDFAGTQERSSYFRTQYSTMADAIDAFLRDFDNAKNRSQTLDNNLLQSAQTTSQDYADLVSLAARQTLAGVDITVSKTLQGGWNMSDVKAFMRDTGNSRRVNPVETIYAALPALLYFNPSWVGMLLSPLLQFQASSLYRNNFAAPDLGSTYPQAAGDTSGVQTSALEDTSDMLITTWAYTTYSGTGDLINIYYDLLKSWADYLLPITLNPSGQLVDGITNPGMTNLAIKGIIAIQSFSSIAGTLGKADVAQNYSSAAQQLAKQWATQATTSGHILSTYAAGASTALIYNLFSDRLFKFSLVDDSVYTAQTNFYQSLVANAPKFGFPVDTSSQPPNAKSQWTMFTAGISTTSGLRNALISMVRTHAVSFLLPGVFPTTYADDTGATPGPTTGGQASPAQGGMFSLLALSLQNASSITIPPLPSSGSDLGGSKSSNGGMIAGIVVGVLVVVFLLAALAFILYRRRRRVPQYSDDSPPPVPPRDPEIIVPFVTQVSGSTLMSSGQDLNSTFRKGRLVWEDSRPQGGSQGGSQSGSSVSASSSSVRPPPSDRKVNLQTTNPTITEEANSGGELRNEVENLRREMAEWRAQRDYDTQPPPQYHAQPL